MPDWGDYRAPKVGAAQRCADKHGVDRTTVFHYDMYIVLLTQLLADKSTAMAFTDGAQSWVTVCTIV
jgi:hypothetical protein